MNGRARQLGPIVGAVAVVAVIGAIAFGTIRTNGETEPGSQDPAVEPTSTSTLVPPTSTVTPTPSPTPEPTPLPPVTPVASGASAGNETVGSTAPPPVTTFGTSPPASGNAPTSFSIPSLGVSASIEVIGILGDGTLDSPHNPHAVGWYHMYNAPGDGGNSLYAAHVDYFPNIIGPFNKLSTLGNGAQIIVMTAFGPKTYEVISNHRYSVAELAARMGQTIWPPNRPQGEEWITMITCGGEFRATSASGAGEYLSRDVVIARLVG